MKKLNKLFAILIAVLGVGSLSAQTWTDITNGNNNTFTKKYADPSTHDVFETWTGSGSGHAFDWNQEVSNIPDGVYELSANAMYRASLTYGTPTNCILYAKVGDKEYTTPIANFADYTAKENRDQISVQMQNNDAYKSKIGYIIVKGGNAIIGIKSIGELAYCTNGYWFVCKKSTFAFKNVTENYFTGLQTKIDRMLANAGNSDAKTALSNARNTYNNATLTDIEALQTAIATFMETASATNPIDVTPYMANPSFEGEQTKNWIQDLGYKQPSDIYQPEGWNMLYSSAVVNNTQYQTFTTQTDKAKDGKCLYVRHRWGDVKAVEELRQSVQELPAGQYKLVVAVKGGSSVTDVNTLILSAGNNTTTTIVSDFDKSNYKDYEAVVIKTRDEESLDICYGFKQTSGNEQLYYIDDFRLYYLGDPKVALVKEILSKKNTLTSYQSKVPTNAYAKYKDHLANAENANKEQTIDELQKIVDNLNADIADAESLSSPFAKLTSLIDLCDEYTDNQNSNANSNDILTTFQTAINTANTASNDATNVETLNTAYNNLESARQTYAKNAVPVYPYGFDMTFLLTNPNFDSDTNGWTATGGAGRMSAGNMECYNGNFTFALADKLTGLGNGTWEVSVDGFYRYGGYNDAEAAHNGGTEDLKVKFYANANEVALKSIMEGANKAGGVGATTTGGVRVPNSPADGNSYFPTGCYSNTVSTLVTDGTLTFGLKKESTQGSDWTLFDNFRLVYKGVDVSELQNSLSALITKANAIKETKMGNTAKTTLTNALNAADATVTIADELNEMLSTLQSAYDVAMASIDTYSKVPAYIAKAKTIGVTLADTYQEQYDNSTIEGNAETVFQALEVATYNYVKENFPYDVELLKAEGWSSKGTNTAAGTFNNEHWSGTTSNYKNQQDGDNWGWGASAWSIDFDQSVTLPAGEYVFKVAGRKSAEATLELTVTMGATILGSVNDFPSSNNAKGINKAGATSFDANDPEGFANNGNGFGWQWRYVKFALATESTVKVAVHAETNAIHQWVSFGDYTLHMDESAYLETNMDGLIAPMEAAEALVGVEPMGKDEATAIQTAIDMTVTTGAELKAKIDALNTAVANANAWVTAYNEAKAPLVAALERFEADYNDAENGALDYMNKVRWATAISMAQAAAEAKDVTDSYDGFEAATSNLVAALDAATVSVGDYAALDAAIKSASSLYLGGNWGDQPFQRPTSAKESLNTTTAQAIYDAAEADGEGVTSVTEALNNGLNGIVLNAPKEGDVFKVAISFDPNWKFNLKPLTFADNGKDGVAMFADRDANYYAQTLMFKKVDGNKYTMSTIAADSTELYASTGSASGNGNSNAQIRLTDDVTKALSIEVIPTAEEGFYNLKNTEANALLGCQDDNSRDKGGLFTVGVRNHFTITKVDMPLVTIMTPSYWATLILPFAAEIPEGLTVYSCAEADGDELTLETVDKIEANTPYLICGDTKEFKHTFTGFGAATATSYKVGLFTGTYVDYKTTANSNTYVLQKQNNDVAFYLVGESEQPTVGAYRCYMVYDGGAGAPKFSFGRGEGTTSVENMEPTTNSQQPIVVYDLMGRKVTTMEKGGMYIVNGKKVVIK